MSLRPSAPEFHPLLPDFHSVETDDYYTTKDSHIITILELGYEFPHTMKAMPMHDFSKLTPIKRVWSEMATAVTLYLKR